MVTGKKGRLEEKKKMIKKELLLIIDKAVKKVMMNHGEAETRMPRYNVEVPPGNIKADYATNAAMILASRLKESTLKIAGELATELSLEKKYFEAVKFMKPGFINIYINKSVFYNELENIIREGHKYGGGNIGSKRKVMIEFVSANPTGPSHVGHGRGAALGDCLANIMKNLGFDVTREYYVNDVGNQINLLADSLVCAGEGKPAPEGGYGGDYLKEVYNEGRGFIEENSGDREAIKKYAVEKIIEKYIKKDMGDFGLVFDNWFYESSLFKEKDGKNKIDAAVDRLKKKGYVYEKGGALWFKSTEFKDDKDRVITRKDKTGTYLASDIAYHYDKFKRGFETVINIWGADHHGYIDRVKGSVKALGYDPDRLKILLYQLVNLTIGGKPVIMSKRKANYVTLRQVIDEVGSDACRFFYLMRNANSPLDFDLELAKKQSQENPVYYVQYAHARVCSIFREAKKMGVDFNPGCDAGLLKEPEELIIIKKLITYPDLLVHCCNTLEPHHLTGYLQDLAGVFHRYYTKHRVIVNDKNLTGSRLMLVKALQVVVRNGLKMMGISAPEKM